MSASIRRAEPHDIPALAEIGERTFRETFLEDLGVAYPPDDLAEFVPARYAEAAFTAMLADSAQAVWVVEGGGKIVPLIGYATAGPCSLPHPEAQATDGELKRIYLSRGARGHGVGKRLLETVLAWLERDGACTIWLGVWSGNPKAQSLYAQYGFVKVGEYDFPVGRWLDHEFIMRRG